MTDRRQDIQVLRAFAVSIVIVFHLNESYLPLGYLGVDVFFVISGFVITRGILARTVSGEAFSASAFLARRVMRLLPALLLTVVATFVLGFLIYSPEQLAMLSLSSMHAVAGLSNIFFFFQTDYFSAPLETMPLLHTWSLSVEEQFYLLFAFVAWVLAATRVNFTAGLLIVWSLAVLASLALNTTDLRFLADYSALAELNDPGSAFHFFMLPSRVYQIGLGVVAACFLARHKRLSLGHEVRLGLYALAATLLCLLIVFGLEHRLLPVAVCLLTVSLLLLGEGKAEFGGHLLLALPRYLGDRSYSLYLVHWPIVVFYSYATSQEVTLGTSIGLVAVTLALGEISFQVAERRSLFDPGRRENKAAVHPALVYSLLGFSSLMITVQNLDGMPSRLQSKVAEAAESEEQTWRLVEKFKPIAGYGRTQTIVPTETPIRYRVLVLGDSHAGQLKGMGTYFSMKYGVEWTTYSGGGCPPVFGYYRIYSVSRVSPLHRQERCRKLASS